MRLSTANTYDNALQALMDRQSTMSDTQQQMTTGKRVNLPSDDPAAAARAERALAAQDRATATQRAVDASKNVMTLSESALGTAQDLLSSARENLVQAGDASYSDADRAAVAAQLEGLRSQLLSVANSTDGQGNYLFGGQGAKQSPFVDTTSGVQFRGTAGAVQAASPDALSLTTDGNATWMQNRTGNGVFQTSALTSTGSAWIDAGQVTNPSAVTGSTYRIDFSVADGATTYSVLKDGEATSQTNVAFTGGTAITVDGMSATISGSPANGDSFQMAPSTPTQSVFATLDKAIADLKTPGRSRGTIAQTNNENLAALDSVTGGISSSRSQMGAEINRISDVTDRISDQKLASTTALSNAVDLDMTQAISDFSNQQTGYDAALKAYSLVQKMSLFNYISS